MRTPLLLVAATLLAATPALAFDGGNVEQPSRIVTQSGQTAGGPIDKSPFAGGSADVVYGAPPVVIEGPVVAGPGYVVDPGPGPAGTVLVPIR